MTSREFAAEFASILGMLADHRFLQYTPTGRAEYRQKESAAIGYFVALVGRATGLALTAPNPDFMPISSVVEPSKTAALSLMRRTIRRLVAAADATNGRQRSALQQEIWNWTTAVNRLRVLGSSRASAEED